MKKRNLFALALAFVCLASSTAFAQDAPKVSILRTWSSPPEADHPYVRYVTEKTGVEPEIRAISGNYAEGLQMIFASGMNVPDVFRPLNTGVDATLVEQDAAVPLDELLPLYAPDMWKNIPERVWNLMRADSKDGHIYIIPQVYIDYAERGWIIRQDWLDKLGLEKPQTKDELVEVLRAFRDRDPNGNGLQDELPTTFQSDPNWMHGFFAMYGVPMFNSDPLWDIYDGKLMYSAITQNAKDALAFMAELYAEGLIDPEAFLNSGTDFNAKIQNDQVGLFYHVLHQADTAYFTNLQHVNPEAKLSAIAPPKVDGYDGFICRLEVANRDWCFPKSNEQNAANVLKYLNWFETEEGRLFTAYGIQGDTWDMVDGKVVYYPEKDSADLFGKRYHGLKGLQANDADFFVNNICAVKPDGLGEMLVDMQNTTFPASRTIAGDGLPLTVYDGYPDHKNHKLFYEYAVNIVTGEWPIEKFDEFVSEWYRTGGDVVEQRANEWYEKYRKLEDGVSD